jgi:putative transposase
MSDALSNGTKFRSFNVLDDYNRKVLFIETAYTFNISRVIWVLNHMLTDMFAPSILEWIMDQSL